MSRIPLPLLAALLLPPLAVPVPTGASAVSTGPPVPSMTLSWSSPERGERDVPIDATLWVKTRGVPVHTAKLNGDEVPFREEIPGILRIDPGRLEPETRYKLRLVGRRARASLRFRTGTTTAGPPPSFELERVSTGEPSPRDEECERFLPSDECGSCACVRRDRGSELTFLGPEPPGVVAWLLSGPVPHLWPARCGPPTTRASWFDAETGRFDLTAIGPGGKTGPTTRWNGLDRFPARTRVVPCEGPTSAFLDQVSPPTVLRRIEPVPTWISGRARVQGVVRSRLEIDENGRVGAVEVTKVLPMGLSEVTVEALRQWRFEPATRDGRAVASPVCLETSFRLPSPPEETASLRAE